MNISNADKMTAYWMPFTAHRRFREAPRLFESAHGMYYVTPDGREILDAIAGLWCVNAGHGRRQIVDAIKATAEKLDFTSSFQVGHPGAFEAAEALAERAPGDLNHVFFSNSGSEAVDTALKMARAFHRARGDGTRTRLIGRARAYHGMGWGGLSVGGIGRHRRDFGPLLPDVSHMRHPYDPRSSAYSVGQPTVGAHYADELQDILTLHDPATVAAVIVEPVAGSTGVYPPPAGYLSRLREICDQHGILLIFDEVITGFGRLGAPFAADAFGVQPDIICLAKGMTNGAVPMGATVASDRIWEALSLGGGNAIELPHGYTYSGHPLACAAAQATISVLDADGLWTRAAETGPIFAAAIHALRGERHVRDIRSIGLLAAVDLEPRADAAGARGLEVNAECFADGVFIRNTADTLLLSPPLIIEPVHIDRLSATLRTALKKVD
jgi:beta-alanine--pyruvate transaminase